MDPAIIFNHIGALFVGIGGGTQTATIILVAPAKAGGLNLVHCRWHGLIRVEANLLHRAKLVVLDILVLSAGWFYCLTPELA